MQQSLLSSFLRAGLMAFCIFLLGGCASSQPTRIHSSAGMPQVPILGGLYRPSEATELTADSDSPDSVHSNHLPFNIGGGYGLGTAVSDEGAVGESGTLHWNFGLNVKPWLAFGGIFFIANNRELTPDDRTNIGFGAYGRLRFIDTGSWRLSAYSAFQKAKNTNDANNCDQSILGNEPKDSNGNCVITWRSHAEATLVNLNVSLLLERQFSDSFSVVFAPGMVYDHFYSLNQMDTAAEVTLEKNQLFPSAMLITRFTLSSGKAAVQLGGGATRFKSFASDSPKWLGIGDISATFELN